MRALLVIAVLATPVFADDATKAEAVSLFDEGIREMKAGNFDKACTALRRSNELHADSGTRGSLARCYEKVGKLASSWRLWTELASTAPKHLRADAAANADKLEPRLPKYMLKLAPGSPAVTVAFDGILVEPTFDVAIPIDPGTYAIEVNADGYPGWRHQFTAVEGKTEEIVIPTLVRPAVVQPGLYLPVEPPAPRRTRRTVGLALVGAGGALAITGTVFGVIARGRFNDAVDLCGGDIDVCDDARLADAQRKVDAARTAGNISTITLIAGGAAVATGIYLIVTSPKASTRISVAPAIGGDAAGVIVRGGF